VRAAPVGCVGVLLAGGAARRFGGAPKGLARIGGERMADLVLASLGAATDGQIVVANDASAPAWFPGARIVADAEVGTGPLRGLATALQSADGSPVLVVAWDMPFVTAPLLRALRDMGERERASVVPVHGVPGRLEPLCAYYRPDALEICLRLLASGERRARALHAALPGARALSGAELARQGDPERLFTSVDSVEQLEALGGRRP
jgi:molybdopterin-guanine dinucleotide biosynthesis protein A